MILSAQEIEMRLGGDIKITDFHQKRLNPNSYNLRLHDELLVYKNAVLDPRIDNPVERFKITDEGFLFVPGQLYLGRTFERTETYGLCPMLEGRSSWARLGLSVHATAGVGDVGFCGTWTLELSVIRPLIIFPMVEICQIMYYTVCGKIRNYSSDKYQNNNDVQSSRIWKEFQ